MRKILLEIKTHPFVFLHKARTTRRKLFFIILPVLVIGGPFVFIMLANPGSALGAWWNDHWQFRKQLSFENAGASDTNKKVLFELDTTTLASDGKMQDDCGDVRFTDENGQPLKYYLDTENGPCNVSNDNGGPVKIDDTGDPGSLEDSGKQLVRTSAGVLYALINDGGSGEIWKSTNGTSWTQQDATDSITSVSGHEIAMAIDSGDTIHILYAQLGTTEEDLKYNTFDTNTDQFGTSEEILAGSTSFGGTDVNHLQLALDSNDIPHILYQYTGSSIDTYYRNKVGGTWSTAVFVAGTSASNYQLIINEDDIPEAVYRVTTTLVTAVGNQNNATSFTTKNLDTSFIYTIPPSIAVDSSGNTWVAYVDENGTDDYITVVKHNDSDDWSTWETPVTNSNTGSNPSIAIYGTDIYVFYENENDDIVYDMYNGSIWLNETVLQTGTYQDVKTKWSYYNNNDTDDQIDYLFSDGTDVYWASLNLMDGTTDFYVLMPSIPAGTNNVYIYYGNPSAPNGTENSQFSQATFSSGTITEGDEETGPAPIVYWQFDEGQGTTANDSSTNNNSGTISGASWAGTGLCIWNKCLQFDGTDDFVTRADDADLDTTASSAMTLSAWFRHAPSTSGTDVIMAKYESTGADGGYKVYMDDDGDIVCGIDDENTSFPEDTAASSTADYDDNQWHRVACVKDGTTSLKLYIDGTLITTDSSISSTGTLENNDAFYVGIDGDGSSNAWAGFLDDVKVYNYARSADQVKADYNSSASVLGAKNQDALSNGLVGYWKMDEASGDAADASGNGATLTNNATSTFATGKYGNAADLESGNSQYFSVSDTTPLSITSDLTITGWINPESVTAATQFTIANKGTDYILAQYGDEIRMYIGSTSNYVTTNDANLSTGTWYHVIGTYDASAQTVKIYVNGVAKTTTITGTIPISISDGTDSLYIGAGTTSSSSTLDKQIATENDDGYRVTRSFTDFANTGTTLFLGDGGATVVDYTTFARFSNITIPTNATITSAYLTIRAVTSPGGTIPTVIVFGEKETNPSAPTSQADMDGRVRTAATASFTPPNWVNGTSYNTSDISPILQELINQGGWSSGNAVQLFLGDSSGYNVTDALYFDSYAVGGAFGPRLHIEYTSPIPTDFYDGKIDELRVYNRAIAPSEAARLYSFAPGPIGYWDFEEKTGATTYDKSGNENTGTLTNDPTWTNGKVGGALSFDGSNDVVDAGSQSIVDDLPQLTYSAWLKVRGDGESSQRVFNKSDNVTGGWDISISSTSDEVGFQVRYDGGTHLDCDALTPIPISSSNPVWTHVAVTWDGTATCSGVTFYINGVKSGNDVNSAGTGSRLTDASYNIRLGNANGTGNTYEGIMDEVKIYNYVRTQQQIIEDMNGGHPVGGSPIASQVGYWKFNEGQGSTVNNNGNGGSVLNGTITNAIWTNSGKNQKALSFDGNDDYVRISDNTAISGLSAITLSLWINPTDWQTVCTGSPPACENYIIAKKNFSTGNTEFALSHESAGGFHTFTWELSSDGTNTTSTSFSTSTSDLPTGTWSHLVATWDSTTDRSVVYINGKQVASNTSFSASSIYDGTAALAIGSSSDNGAGGTGDDFSGKIDDFKLYNSALTAEQVKLDYNAGKSIRLGALGTDASGNPSNAADRAYCPPGDTTATCGPVLYWKFDDIVGNAADSSGNGFTGTLANNPKYGEIGKIGKAFDFVASSNSYVSRTDNSSLRPGSGGWSYMAWVKPANTNMTAGILSKLNLGTGEGYAMLICQVANCSSSGQNFIVSLASNSTTRVRTSITTSDWIDGNWHHIAAVADPTADIVTLYIDGKKAPQTQSGTGSWPNITDTSDLRVGSFSSNGFDYPIDEVKIYNYARTPAQIAWDYNQGKPVAHWKMDENTGAILHDSSGNGNTSSTFTGNVAFDTGKRNYGLTFDGTDDVVRVPESVSTDLGDLNTSYSISAWFKTSANYSTSADIVSKNNTGSSPIPFDLYINTSEQVCFLVLPSITSSNACSNASYNDGNWHHAVGVRHISDNKSYIYVDGILVGNDTGQSGAANTNADISIGNGGASYTSRDFNGSIDDVQIFNYALTQQQVRNVMNNGAVRWGPVTGTP